MFIYIQWRIQSFLGRLAHTSNTQRWHHGWLQLVKNLSIFNYIFETEMRYAVIIIINY